MVRPLSMSTEPAEPVDADEEEDASVDLSDETSRLSQGRPTDKKPKRIGKEFDVAITYMGEQVHPKTLPRSNRAVHSVTNGS